jgi:hypothetical protein
MAFTVFSAAAAPNTHGSGNVRREQKSLAEVIESVGPSLSAPPKETGPPSYEQVPAVTASDGVGGMAYDNYLKMLAAQRAFAQTEPFGTADQTSPLGGNAAAEIL